MKHIAYSAAIILMVAASYSCKDKKTTQTTSTQDSIQQVETDNDSTIYGICGEGTSMHSLQLISDNGDSLQVFIDDTTPDIVQGGLLQGDHIALIASKSEQEGLVAQKVINLTSLIGKWTSLDKNFEIEEGGTIHNNVKAETNPWTSWKILNGRLLLNTDTFDIAKLGPDSLWLENPKGIFTYKRQM